MITLDSHILRGLMKEVLEARNVNPDSIHHVIESTITTSLRGVDSHGINLFPHYCRAFEGTRLEIKPNFKIDKTSGGTLIVDADHAIGHHAGAVAMDATIELAKENGIACANVINSTHFGAAAYFGLRAANANCLGFAFTNADSLTKAFSSTESFFGTNPICFTAPIAGEGPYCLDMATSITSWNNIKNHRRGNKNIPSDWACDAKGKGVTDPHDAVTLNPIGEHKGFGLGMMVEILCSTLMGGVTAKDLLGMYTAPLDARRKLSHFFMVIDVSKFTPVDVFKNNMKGIVERIRALPQMEGALPMMVAGDPQKKEYVKRIDAGIPMFESVFEDYLSISESFKKAVISEKISS